MRKLSSVNHLVVLITNGWVFLLLVSIFVLVFFFPEVIGEIVGRVINGFESVHVK